LILRCGRLLLGAQRHLLPQHCFLFASRHFHDRIDNPPREREIRQGARGRIGSPDHHPHGQQAVLIDRLAFY
jgi:hypothetical protein